MAMFHSSLVIYYTLSHTPGRCEILSASMLVRESMLVLCRAGPCLVPYAWASKQEGACQEPSRVGVAQSGTVYSVLGCLLSHRENREQSRTPSSTAALWAQKKSTEPTCCTVKSQERSICTAGLRIPSVTV